MARRRSRFVAPGPRAGSVLLTRSRSGPRRRGRRQVGGGLGRGGGLRVLVVLVVLAALAGGVLVWRSLAGGDRGRRAAAERYAMAWVRGQWSGMWRALTPGARAAYPEARFVAAYPSAGRAGGVRTLRTIKVGAEGDGGGPVRVRDG